MEIVEWMEECCHEKEINDNKININCVIYNRSEYKKQ